MNSQGNDSADTTHHTTSKSPEYDKEYYDYEFYDWEGLEQKKEEEKHSSRNFKPRMPKIFVRKVEKRMKRFNQKVR